jgi:hypothetical protein
MYLLIAISFLLFHLHSHGQQQQKIIERAIGAYKECITTMHAPVTSQYDGNLRLRHISP